MDGALERSFDRLRLSSSPDAPVLSSPPAPHPATFVDKPLPRLPPTDTRRHAAYGAPPSPKGVGRAGGSWGRDGGQQGRQQQQQQPPPRFGLPVPPSTAPPAAAAPAPVEQDAWQATAHSRQGPSYPPPPASSLGAASASTSPSSGPSRAALLNARFQRHYATTPFSHTSQSPRPPYDAPLYSAPPPGYSLVDPRVALEGPPPPAWTTRPEDRPHAQQYHQGQPPSPSTYQRAPSVPSVGSSYGPSVGPPTVGYSTAVQPTGYLPPAAQHPRPPPAALPYPLSSPARTAAPSRPPPILSRPLVAHEASDGSSVLTPPRRRPPSSASSPAASSSSAATAASPAVQCEGYTQKGQRCRKKVRAAGTGANGAGSGGYCHAHRGMILKEEGFYLGGGGRTWVEFQEWIPGYLSDECQVALRVEMERPLSMTDMNERGWVYAFIYRGLETQMTRTFKLGLSRNPIARLDQWARQCPSHDPVLLGVVPSAPPSVESAGGRLRGARTVPGEGVRGAARLERLVHLEIGGMTRAPRSKEECQDCKKHHQELFALPRLPSGREWEQVVRPVMLRWERFVRLVADETASAHG